MKTTVTIVLLLFCTTLSAQNATPDTALFDFWVGEWDLTWTSAEGKIETGTNHIIKILDGRVIQENFRDAKNAFKGTSLSVYNPQQKIWHQAWADNQGGYFDFEGSVAGEKRMFSTRMREANGVKMIQRMVFYNIKADGFAWDWERSKDGGKTWELRWRINYKRKEKA